jgi:hypothetical protein
MLLLVEEAPILRRCGYKGIPGSRWKYREKIGPNGWPSWNLEVKAKLAEMFPSSKFKP